MTTTVTTYGRTLVSGVAALLLTAGSIAFAAAPARAETPHGARVIVTVGPTTGLVGALRY